MKWLSNLLKSASLTTALFIFQACYGTPYGYDPEVLEGPFYGFQVTSAEDGKPLKNVEVSLLTHNTNGTDEWFELGYTDGAGHFFSLISLDYKEPEFRFRDYNRIYEVKDTVLKKAEYDIIQIKLTRKAE